MKKLDKVKVGIVGLGHVSYFHMNAYADHPDAEIVAVCDLNEAQAKAMAERYGVKKYYTDYSEMLNDSEINTVDITTPTFLHAKMVIRAAEAGKNILCEKPFCMTLKEGQLAIDAARKNGVTLMVGESYVFTSPIMKARELIDAGEIGKPTQIRQRFAEWVERPGSREARPVASKAEWRLDSDTAGGNGYPWMYDHCVHFFATAEYLMNDSKIKEIYALKSDLAWNNQGNVNNNVNSIETEVDIPIIVWSHEDSACQGVWMRAEHLNGKYDKYKGFSVIVNGEKGMLEVLGEGGAGLQHDGKEVHVILYRKDGSVKTFTFEEGGDDLWQSSVSYYGTAHRNQIFEFIDALTEGRETRYTGEDGLRAVQATMAAICSSKENRPVTLTEVTDEKMK